MIFDAIIAAVFEVPHAVAGAIICGVVVAILTGAPMVIVGAAVAGAVVGLALETYFAPTSGGSEP